MGKEKRKKQIILGIILVSLLFLTIGVSFAFFTYTKQGSTINSITTGNLTFYYDEKEAVGNGITLSNAFPMSDEVGKKMTGGNQVFDFQVVSNAVGEAISYEVVMQKQASSTLSGNHVKVYLTTVDGTTEQEVSNSVSNGNVKTYTDYENTWVKDVEGKTLYQETIANGMKNYEKNFRLRMWLSEDATSVVGGKWAYSNKEFSIKVNVYANPEIQEPAVMKERNCDYYSGICEEEYFYTSKYLDGIVRITIADYISIPSDGVIEQWDMSENGDGSVMAWVTANSEDPSKYDLIIAGEGGVTIRNGSFLFADFVSLTSIDLSDFDTSQVTNMSGMFSGCHGLTSLDLSNFDTSRVTDMSYMFSPCPGLTSLDLSNFDTSRVTNMDSMFSTCSSLTSLDLSNFDTSQVTNMGSMFQFCSSLASLDLSNLDTSQVTNMGSMFQQCSSLTSLNVSNFDTSQVTNMGNMFSNCSSLTSLDLSNFDTSQVTDMGYMFRACSSLTSLDLSNFDTSQVTDMGAMFQQCSSLTSLNVSNFDTSRVTDMRIMFHFCSSLTSLDLSNFDTSQVTDMGRMFESCSRLTSLDLSNADFSNITFSGASGIFSDTPNSLTVLVGTESAKSFIEGLSRFGGTVEIV